MLYFRIKTIKIRICIELVCCSKDHNGRVSEISAEEEWMGKCGTTDLLEGFLCIGKRMSYICVS